MGGCEVVGQPPRRVVVRVKPGFDIPSELRRAVPDKVLVPLTARASHRCDKAKREVRTLVEEVRSTHTAVVPPGADPAGVARTLASWEGAASVYLEPQHALPPSFAPGEPNGTDWLGALGAPVEGADGRGVSFVDLEWGWAPHEALPRVEAVFGESHGWWWHGNAVLGVIVGRTDRARGLAPRAHAGFASPWTAGGGYEVARAIAAAAGSLDPGDVLLIELQARCGDASGLPVEVDPLVADVIALASRAGILVVEAAGNGGWELDEVCVSGRGRGEIGSSGALLVGAMVPNTKTRDPSSSWGDGVDCCAWGDDVGTAWSNHVGTASNVYTPAFSGTSAAAAMIAGVAIAVQSAAKARGRTLLPDDFHELLRRGTRVPGVGVLPDLRRIVAGL